MSFLGILIEHSLSYIHISHVELTTIGEPLCLWPVLQVKTYHVMMEFYLVHVSWNVTYMHSLASLDGMWYQKHSQVSLRQEVWPAAWELRLQLTIYITKLSPGLSIYQWYSLGFYDIVNFLWYNSSSPILILNVNYYYEMWYDNTSPLHYLSFIIQLFSNTTIEFFSLCIPHF